MSIHDLERTLERTTVSPITVAGQVVDVEDLWEDLITLYFLPDFV